MKRKRKTNKAAGAEAEAKASFAMAVMQKPGSRPRQRPKLATLAEVEREVVRAREKFPGNKKMLAALMEEVGELARALLQRKPQADVKKECIQIAATAVRIFEEGDADFAAGKWGAAP